MAGDSHPRMGLLLIGKTGSGKSTFGNSLLNQNLFKVGRGMESDTAKCERRIETRNEIRVLVMDTPGLCDTNEAEAKIYHEVGKSVAVASPGPHMLVFTLRTDRRFSKEEKQANVQPKRCLFIVFKRRDALGDVIAEHKQALDEEVIKMPGELKQVVQEAKYRNLGMINTASSADKETMIQEAMIKFLEQIKGGNFHTTTFCEILLLCERQAFHRKMCYSRLNMMYPRTAEFTRVPECVDYFEQKITEGRKTTASAMKDTVVRIFAELSSSMSCDLSRQLVLISLFIMVLMIRGCSTNPLPQASCIARHCVVGEPTAVTCLFGKNISASRLGVHVQRLPFNAPSSIAGKDVLMCSWKKNTTTCFVEDGYSFNYNISDRLTLEIPVATPEIAGVYKCHVALEVVPPRACSLTVTEGSESRPTPTTTHETTGKETSNTTEPSWTLGQESAVVVVLISLIVILTVLVCFTNGTLLKLYSRRMTKKQNREAEDIKTPLKY